jgi:hypothetical protein
MQRVGGRDSVGKQTTEALRPYVDDLTGHVAATGHFVAEEDPEWFVDTVLTFLGADR